MATVSRRNVHPQIQIGIHTDLKRRKAASRGDNNERLRWTSPRQSFHNNYFEKFLVKV